MTQHRRPTPPEIFIANTRSLSPPEPVSAVRAEPDAGWFVALKNVEETVLRALAEHEQRDEQRFAELKAGHEEQAQRIKALEAKVGLAGLIGAGLGGAAPQLIEWLLR